MWLLICNSQNHSFISLINKSKDSMHPKTFTHLFYITTSPVLSYKNPMKKKARCRGDPETDASPSHGTHSHSQLHVIDDLQLPAYLTTIFGLQYPMETNENMGNHENSTHTEPGVVVLLAISQNTLVEYLILMIPWKATLEFFRFTEH